MVITSTINRLVATALDFDASGLNIVSYYLRLYAVEQILGEENRPGEETELASELLTSIEDYKSFVESNGEDGVRLLLHDQEKARIYLSNFAMSLYNGKLQQVQDGPWDTDLKRGLWCCLDLFACIIHLWEDSNGSYRKRVKYCKLYLSKLAKGELGGNFNGKTDVNLKQKTSEPQSPILNVLDTKESREDAKLVSSAKGVEEPEPTPAQLDYGDFMEEEAEDDVMTSEGKLNDMLARLKANEEEEEEEEDDDDDGENLTPRNSGAEPEHKAFSLPQVPQDKLSSSHIEKTPDEVRDMPKFLDSEDEEETKETKEEATRAHTKESVTDMMDRSSKIDQIQRRAKYAISALNYEDLLTATDELTNALEILKSIK